MSVELSISIVSHGHGTLIAALLADLRRVLARQPGFEVEILLTLNIPEDEAFLSGWDGPELQVHRNGARKGFGANHNAAFVRSRGRLFAIVNPDVRIEALDFEALTAPFRMPGVGAAGPRVVSDTGRVEDSARRFPTALRLAHRALAGGRVLDYEPAGVPVEVDWLAGMFVVFEPAAWREVGGFDERYFMYYEDADLCRRLRRRGWRIVYVGAVTVTHEARRASHRDLRHLRWHLQSMLRFLAGA